MKRERDQLPATPQDDERNATLRELIAEVDRPLWRAAALARLEEIEEWLTVPRAGLGATCASCGFMYSVHKGSIIPCPLCTPRSESAAIPAGWKLVPVEPTQPMLVASWNASGVGRSPDEDREVWSAMLNAAPEAPR